MKNANLEYACLNNAVLRDSTLRGANLQYANLKECILDGCDLQYANLNVYNYNILILKVNRNNLIATKDQIQINDVIKPMSYWLNNDEYKEIANFVTKQLREEEF